MMEELRDSEHRVVITNREQIQIYGVLHVDSFDDAEIILETDLGLLALQGEELHIKQLDLDQGRLEIEGIVKSMDYVEEMGLNGIRKKGKGFFERVFK